MVAGQDTGAPERIGPMILRVDRRLRGEISVDSAHRIVVSHTRHNDVALPNLVC
jgi:hypothetical protein